MVNKSIFCIFVENLKLIKMKRDKIIYYVSTGLLTLMMLMSAGMYFFNNAEITTMFEGFGYPTYIIYPYGMVKILGLVAIWFLKDSFLKEWAYAGFFFAFILAFFAHFMIGDGEQIGAVMAMVLLVVSYIYSKKI